MVDRTYLYAQALKEARKAHLKPIHWTISRDEEMRLWEEAKRLDTPHLYMNTGSERIASIYGVLADAKIAFLHDNAFARLDTQEGQYILLMNDSTLIHTSRDGHTMNVLTFKPLELMFTYAITEELRKQEFEGVETRVKTNLDHLAHTWVSNIYFKINAIQMVNIDRKFPVTWVDAFKERYFPTQGQILSWTFLPIWLSTWIMKLCQVNYTYIKVDVRALYPKMPVMNGHAGEMYVMVYPTEPVWYNNEKEKRG